MSRMSVWLLLVAIFVPTITISATPSPWRLLSTLPHPSTPVSITFALHGSNESRTELERAHAEISDPTHARFRKYLNDDELDTLMTRPSSTVEPIRTWLHDSFHSTFNITHIHNTTHPDNNDAISVISSRWANYIVVTCNTTIMSTWLNTELVMYQHINHEHPIIAVDDAHLQNHSHPLGMMSSIIPSHLHQHIAYIVGVHELPMMIQANVHARKVKNSDGTLKGIPRKDDMPLTDLMTATQNVGDPEPPWQDDYIFSAQTDDRDVVLLLFATCPDRSTRATYSQGSYYCIMTDTQTYRLSAFNKMWKRDTDSEWSSEMMNKLYITPSDGSENDEHTVYVHHRIDDYHSYQFAVDMIWSSTSSSNQITLPVKYNHTVVAATRLLPAWLKAFYRFPYQATANNPNLIQAIGTMRVGMGPNVGGYYSPSDLHAFYDYADISRGNLDRVSFMGDTNDEYHPDLETQLDIQWISGMAPGARSIVWHTSRNAGSPFEDILGQIQNQPAEKRPHVLSFSYGADEYNYYKLNKAGANHINEMFMAFGVGGHGMTILFASGDSGAYNSVEGCSTMYRPFFPASSPYVLTVGATQLKNPRSNTSCPVEVACSISNAALITTGGGFSWYSPRPSWQNNVTSQYFNKSSTCYPQGTTRYNASGRGYPDISLLGHAYTVVHQGQQVSVDGTSASAPTLAGFLSMYNDLLLSAGKPTLGFVNPLLYHIASLHPEAFNDITEGDTTCLDQQRDSNHKYGNHCCRDGFKACKGWDPVSGLGSPNFEILGPYLLDGLSNFKGTIQEPYLQGCSPEPSRWSIYLILAIAAVSVILIALIACTVRRKYIKARSERQEALLSSRPGGHTIQSRGRTGSSSSWGVRPPTRDSQHERETRNRVLATRYTGMNQDMRQPLTTTTTSESNDDHSSSYVPPQQQQDIRMKAVRTPPLPDTVSTTEVVADTIPDRRIIAEARATRFQSRQG